MFIYNVRYVALSTGRPSVRRVFADNVKKALAKFPATEYSVREVNRVVAVRQTTVKLVISE
jgi:hypothetical protein